jgi:hypothetical protein
MTVRAVLIAAGAALLGPGPVLGGEFRPPGCEVFLTVQSRGCEVSHHYTCAGEPAGHQWRSDFGINGRLYDALIDAEAQWLRSKSYADGTQKVLAPDASDPASLSTLLSEGYDSMDFRQTDQLGGVHHYQGFDRIVGETVIDGVPLKATEFDMTERDAEGNFIDRYTGSEYVHPEMGRFFGGTFDAELADGETFSGDRTPVDFIFPGEPGFADTIPLYQCDDVVSSLRLHEEPLP